MKEYYKPKSWNPRRIQILLFSIHLMHYKIQNQMSNLIEILGDYTIY